MKYTITINRAGIGQINNGIPVPCIRINEEGVSGDRYVHELYINGSVRIGPIVGKLIAAETDGPITEVVWVTGSPERNWQV